MALHGAVSDLRGARRRRRAGRARGASDQIASALLFAAEFDFLHATLTVFSRALFRSNSRSTRVARERIASRTLIAVSTPTLASRTSPMMSLRRVSAASSCALSELTLRSRRSALLVFVLCLRLAISHMRNAADSAADACTTLCDVIVACSSVLSIKLRILFLFASIFSSRSRSNGVSTFVISSRIFSHSTRKPGKCLLRIFCSFCRRSRHGSQLHGHPSP